MATVGGEENRNCKSVCEIKANKSARRRGDRGKSGLVCHGLKLDPDIFISDQFKSSSPVHARIRKGRRWMVDVGTDGGVQRR